MRYGSDEQHRRRLMLMRMQGETNRMETRRNFAVVVAIVLGALALILASVS